MHAQATESWQHDHAFGQDRQKPGERRTLLVVLITAAMMMVEIVAGIAFGSMALLADGLHMASHSVALGVNLFAYVYARRRATDARFCFGTGKVNALGGFTGAILLMGFAVLMAWEGTERFFFPVPIVFDQAIIVAVLGLLVNGVCVLILGASDQGHEHGHHHDQNLRSAHLHVLADMLTSVLAVLALLAGRFLGTVWMDPLMGIVGAVLVARWSWGLTRQSSSVLLDHQGPHPLRQSVAEALESDGETRVTDLHVWSIGPGVLAAAIAVVRPRPVSAEYYKSLLADHGLAHVTIEVNSSFRASDSPVRLG